jgi:16S rRNA A1518/A1519 N6-dimethyltransferase RsmA/KsgA/DIM1 with predicted DNA glycosylase/AP lyase activity
VQFSFFRLLYILIIPKVDSAILTIENINRDYFNLFTEEKFFALIKRAFSHKRKTLLNTLFNNDKITGIRIFERMNLRAAVRPEELTFIKQMEGAVNQNRK